ncbi:hypothetical protein J2793_007461 [Paraburkholderia caledonica]|uniref:Uncharacterized protein n=1 Tax=Paraburkholderia caledonica TaxID=134536 RepID=A0AB73IQL5_9BURK|nr:hypothetical protein [Paraburkholderia caledonica]
MCHAFGVVIAISGLLMVHLALNTRSKAAYDAERCDERPREGAACSPRVDIKAFVMSEPKRIPETVYASS